jgi:hypothetical protein
MVDTLVFNGKIMQLNENIIGTIMSGFIYFRYFMVDITTISLGFMVSTCIYIGLYRYCPLFTMVDLYFGIYFSIFGGMRIP